MKRSANRILTTHAGSLAWPLDLLEMMDAKLCAKPYDHEAYGKRIRSAVAEMVQKQVECGVDVVTDAELVGRENVIGGSDCGFSSQATFKQLW